MAHLDGGAAAPCIPDRQRWRQLENEWLDDPCEAVPQQVRSSSRGRPWNGMSVWLQRGPAVDLYIAPIRKHAIVIRRSAATPLLQVHGGQSSERPWAPGEALIVPAGTASFWRSEGERDNLHINLDPAWLARAAGDGDGPLPRLRDNFGVADPLLCHFGELLIGSLDSNASLNPAFADGIAMALALHLMEHHAQADTLPRRTGALSRRQLALITDAVQADLHADWSLDRLAALVQLSPFHFARAFKAACGESPHRHLLRLRLERARQLVLTTGQPLIDIAVDTGFASLSHFGQAFRRQWGASPGRLRRAN